MKKIFLPVLFASVLIVGLLSTLLPSSASAVVTSGGAGGGNDIQDASYAWVNESEIDATYGNTTLAFIDPSAIQDHDQEGSDSSTLTFRFIDNDTCQPSTIYAASGAPGSLFQSNGSNGDYIYTQASANAACVAYTVPNHTPLVADSNASIVYTSSGNTITRIDGNSNYTFTQTSNPNVYTDNSESGSCKDTIYDNNGSYTLYELTNPSGPNSNNPDKPLPSSIATAINATGCDTSLNDDDINGPTTQGNAVPTPCTEPDGSSGQICSTYPEANGGFKINVGTAANQTSGEAGDGTSTTATATCQSSGSSLAWIACPIVDAFAGTIDAIQNGLINPLLKTPPIAFQTCQGGTGDASVCAAVSGTSDSHSNQTLIYGAWSGFRDIADILLILALLVIVFGESIGGGLIDAYTAKKVLPRLLVAAVLINLSIYLVAAAVDITNVIGGGIGSILEQPFKAANGAITLNAGGAIGVGFTSLLGAGAVVGTIWAVVTGAILPFLPIIALFVLLPAVLIFIAILVTIILRQGLILLLVIVSPVAFALYCLPNTEKYFRQWWDWLFKALLVYPLIAVMFAIAFDLSVTISSIVAAGQNGALAALAQLLSVVALIIPLALIPFAFRIAGGLLGKTHELLTNYGKRGHELVKGNINNPNSLRNIAKTNASSAFLQGRTDAGSFFDRQSMRIGAGAGQLSRRQRFGRGALGLASRATFLKGDEYRRAALNKAEAERTDIITTFGPDDTVRDVFAYEGKDAAGRPNGRFYEYFASPDPTNPANRNYHKEIPAARARRAQANSLGNVSAFQEALYYEMTKAQNDGHMVELKNRFLEIAQQEGWSEKQAKENWKGPAYKNKAVRLENKHDTVTKHADGSFTFDGTDKNKFAEELGTKLRTFDIGNLQPSTHGFAINDIEDMIGKVGSGTALTPAELARAQQYYHGYTNLEYGATLQPPAGGQQAGPSTGQMSFGGSGMAAAKAQEALGKVKNLNDLVKSTAPAPPPPGPGVVTPPAPRGIEGTPPQVGRFN